MCIRDSLRGEHNTRVLMLAGPSAAGKTTTAHMLAEAFGEKGVRARIVSLDNFFYGRGIAPVMPDGESDYESLEAVSYTHLDGHPLHPADPHAL